MNVRKTNDCQASYDQVAQQYARRLFDELQYKPLDRQLLDRFAVSVGNSTPTCDLGCGPGQVAHYLHEQGVQICGIDLSPMMVEQARHLTPEIEFRAGDMRALEAPADAWAGIVAFYSLIHIPPCDMAQVLNEFRRVLQPGGLLLLAFHLGDGVIHLDEWWEREVCVDFFLYRLDEMAGYLRAAGFEIEAMIEREPYPDVEHQSRRAYIFARCSGEMPPE